jgi:hypothetical protein
MARKISSYSLLLLLFLSSLGLPVFTHVCHGMDETWLSLFVPPKGCCDKVGYNTKTCKSASEGDEGCTLSKNPCCEDEVSLATLGANFTTPLTSSFSLLPIAEIPVTHFYPNLVGYSIHTNVQTNWFDYFPIPRYGRSLLIFEQLFLC